MHILLIPSWYPKTSSDIGGSFFREQALALCKHGCQIGVITLQLRSRGWRSVFNKSHNITFEDDQGVATYRKHGVHWSLRVISWIWKRSILKLFEYYIKRHGKPDIIHVHSMLYAGVAAKVISEKYQIPYIVTEHSSAFARGIVTSDQKNTVKKIAVSANKRFAVSNSLANLLFCYFDTENSSWGVMPNIVHDRFFNPSIKPSSEKSQFTFINIALLTENKGVDFLIKAFAEVLAVHPGLQLKIGGDGKERLKLKALSQDLGIANNIQFLGLLNREQVVEQISASDVFVLSSQYETFGVVVIEALALGKPVIATRCGGPEDIIRKEDGILVPVSDVDAMADAMLDLYNNSEAYEHAEIRSACHRRFSEETITNKLMKEYRHVVGNKC